MRKIALVPGSFKPPHVGHLNMVKFYANLADKVIIFVSPTARRGETGLEFDLRSSFYLWNLYLEAEGLTNKVAILESPVNSPVAAVYNFISNEDDNPDYAQPGEVILLGVSTKQGDTERFAEKRIRRHTRRGVRVELDEKYFFDADKDQEGRHLSSTDMRNIVEQKDLDSLEKYLPTLLYGKTEEIMKELYKLAQSSKIEINEENNENYMMDRNTFITSLMEKEQLKEIIKYAIKAEQQLLENEENDKLDIIRKAIRHLIKEGQDSSPHENTGINVLEDLLKKIIPTIEQDYKKLTSSKEQRDSYRSHIINAVQGTLVPVGVTDAAPDPESAFNVNEEITVTVGDEDLDSRFIDIENDSSNEESDDFSISGEDETGRNFAQETFGKISKQIVDAFGLLADNEDRELFYDYLITNLKLYFDKFEEELSVSTEEPTTDEYETAKSEV